MDDDSINDYDEEELNNIIILSDENGEDVEFEFLDLIEYDSEEYIVLLPVAEDGEEEDGQVVILKVDEEILNEVFQIFKEKFKDEFNFTDEN